MSVQTNGFISRIAGLRPLNHESISLYRVSLKSACQSSARRVSACEDRLAPCHRLAGGRTYPGVGQHHAQRRAEAANPPVTQFQRHGVERGKFLPNFEEGPGRFHVALGEHSPTPRSLSREFS